MKLSTHLAVGIGVAGLVSSYVNCSLACWVLSLISSATVNLLVDIVGHDHRLFRPPTRTRITHSLPGIFVLSVLVAWLIQRGTPLTRMDSYGLYMATIFGGLSHWFLDALNPSGVFLIKRRYRIAKISYNSFLANMLLQMTGGALLLYSIMRIYGGLG